MNMKRCHAKFSIKCYKVSVDRSCWIWTDNKSHWIKCSGVEILTNQKKTRSIPLLMACWIFSAHAISVWKNDKNASIHRFVFWIHSTGHWLTFKWFKSICIYVLAEYLYLKWRVKKQIFLWDKQQGFKSTRILQLTYKTVYIVFILCTKYELSTVMNTMDVWIDTFTATIY